MRVPGFTHPTEASGIAGLGEGQVVLAAELALRPGRYHIVVVEDDLALALFFAIRLLDEPERFAEAVQQPALVEVVDFQGQLQSVVRQAPSAVLEGRLAVLVGVGGELVLPLRQTLRGDALREALRRE